MKKSELKEKVASTKTKTGAALQLVYNELNQGQQKKLLNNEEIAALFALYGVEVN